MEVAHEVGFKVLVAGFGATALTLARQYQLAAITLDISLPDIDGWRVLERLKKDVETRHVPVKVISTGEDLGRGLTLGALAVVRKPVRTREDLRQTVEGLRECLERRRREVILVHEDAGERAALCDLLASDEIEILAVASPSAATERLRARAADCVVLGGGAADGGLEILAHAIGETRYAGALIAYGPPEWRDEVEGSVKSAGGDVTVVGVGSRERLVDQCMLRLHRPVASMSDRQRQIVEGLYHGAHALTDRRVLVVDDDIRNIFALTSVLETHGMRVFSAETGRDAIRLLDGHPDVEIVLMDVMMPELDGFETMRMIRQEERFKGLPVIAVTAKAMKGDREKCIEAGASDYLAKPVDPEELVAKLREWMFR
jgi:CheY-like chemotaxis protein